MSSSRVIPAKTFRLLYMEIRITDPLYNEKCQESILIFNFFTENATKGAREKIELDEIAIYGIK